MDDLSVRMENGGFEVLSGDVMVASATPESQGAWAWQVESRGRKWGLRYETSPVTQRLRWSWRLAAYDDAREVAAFCRPLIWARQSFELGLAPDQRLRLRHRVNGRWRLTDADRAELARIAYNPHTGWKLEREPGAFAVHHFELVILLAAIALWIDELTNVRVGGGDAGGGGF
jgi:hypothetical protein